MQRQKKPLLKQYHFTYHLRRCSNVLISTWFYQQRNKVALNVAKTTSVYQPFEGFIATS